LAPGQFEGTVDHFFRLVHPDDSQRVERSVSTALQERRLYECEFRVLRPDGGLVWVANRGRAQYDANGRAVAVQGTILDITDRKTSEQRMQVALEASGTGTFRWDIRTDHLSWDEALDALFGLRPARPSAAWRSSSRWCTRTTARASWRPASGARTRPPTSRWSSASSTRTARCAGCTIAAGRSPMRPAVRST
jgi:PAS domain-containing protein